MCAWPLLYELGWAGGAAACKEDFATFSCAFWPGVSGRVNGSKHNSNYGCVRDLGL